MSNQERKKEKKEERRQIERFAWLGPMMERRKVTPQPADEPGAEPEDEGKPGK